MLTKFCTFGSSTCNIKALRSKVMLTAVQRPLCPQQYTTASTVCPTVFDKNDVQRCINARPESELRQT